MTAIDPDSILLAAAGAVADAEQGAGRTATVLAAAGGGLTTIAARVLEVQTRRDEILARRRRGERHADDGAQLELTAVDLADLAAMLRDAEAAMATAQTAHHEAESRQTAGCQALDDAHSL